MLIFSNTAGCVVVPGTRLMAINVENLRGGMDVAFRTFDAIFLDSSSFETRSFYLRVQSCFSPKTNSILRLSSSASKTLAFVNLRSIKVSWLVLLRRKCWLVIWIFLFSRRKFSQLFCCIIKLFYRPSIAHFPFWWIDLLLNRLFIFFFSWPWQKSGDQSL